MAEMVQGEGPKSAARTAATSRQVAAMLERAGYLARRGRLQEAHEIYARLLALAPDHAEANHQQGLLLRQAGRLDAAAELLGRAVAAEPDNPVYRSNYGVVLKDAGRLEEAVTQYEAALAQDPGLAHTRSNLGVALLGLGRVDEAIAAQRAALAAAPDLPEAHANLGLALVEARDLEGAIAAERQAVALRPDYASAHLYLAQALQANDALEAAEASCRQAIALRPMQAAAHHTLALILMQADRPEEAVPSYRTALQLQPDATAYRNLGSALNRVGNFREAAVAFRAALAIEEEDAKAHVGLGHALIEMGGTPRGLAAYRRAVEIDPEVEGGRSGLASALMRSGLIDEAFEQYRLIDHRNPNLPETLLGRIFGSNYLSDVPAEQITRDSRLLGLMLAADVTPRVHFDNTPDPVRRLRVGLVSGDFMMHPVAFFLRGPLAAIDPGVVELFAYDNSALHDEMTDRLKPLVPNWRRVVLMDDDALADMIVADGIDVLVDLSGYTGHRRLGAFARKPAPVTATWLGYSGTTGLPTMDYVLADAVVAPHAEEQLFSEKVWRLPDSYLCFTPPDELDAVAPLPALARGHVTFGSFNNLNKVNDHTIGLWARVLERIPTARIAIKSTVLRRQEAGAELLARFARFGVPEERVTLLGYEPDGRAHLAAYGEIDIGLDPSPYNGTTTTCEALLMGVPVLTPRGDRFIAHVGESIVRSVGLPDWVAADEAQFIEKAAAFAADIPRLAALRAGLRPQLLASPLCDAPRFARHLEAAFRGMWQAWCAAQGTNG